MDGLIQNALVHSTGQVTVRIDGNCIYVMNDAPQDIGFQIVRGEVYSGQLPTESTAEFGTATGLPWLLKTIGRESESSVRFDMWWHAGLVTAEVTLPYDSILENHEGQVTPLVLSPSRERITFICHDNVPDRSFTDVHSVPIQGAQYFSLKNAPRMFDYFPESAILEQFFDDNRKTFDDTFLCVVHTGVGGFQPFLSTMVERFPHMVIYAVTSDPNLFYRPETRSYDRSITASLDEHDLLARNSLTWQTVERFLRLEDRVTFAELNQWLHHRSPPTHIWQTLMRVAERMGTALTSGG